MRRPFLLCALVALSLPVLASAGTAAAEDGTLSVKNGSGSLRIGGPYLGGPARGALIGRCDSCSFILRDVVEGDGSQPIVNGQEESKDPDDDGTNEWFTGTNIRFRLIGGKYVFRIKGKGIDLSVVGTGLVRVRGREGDEALADGTYSLNGEDPRSLPSEWKRFRLAAPTAAPAP
jgi:hypothetical protein